MTGNSWLIDVRTKNPINHQRLTINQIFSICNIYLTFCSHPLKPPVILLKLDSATLLFCYSEICSKF